MNIYIAARFSKRPEANALANRLQEMGHTIVSRWVRPDCDHVLPTGISAQAADAERERFALEDLEGLKSANCLVSLQEEPRGNGRGGRHVEFGYALATCSTVVCIGPKETVFHNLPWVEHFDTVGEFLQTLRYAGLDTPQYLV